MGRFEDYRPEFKNPLRNIWARSMCKLLKNHKWSETQTINFTIGKDTKMKQTFVFCWRCAFIHYD